MFGQSVFESVLDRLKAEARESARHDDEPETEDGATGVRGLPTGFAGLGTGHASGHETLLELTEKRRLFARANHPDRAPTEFRDNATIRMKIANMLIDETVRRIHVRKQLGL